MQLVRILQEGMEYPADGSIPPVHDFMLEDTQARFSAEFYWSKKK